MKTLKNEFLLQPIPHQAEPNWSQVSRIPIHESDEPLVPLSLAPDFIKIFPVYKRLGIPGAVTDCFIREGVYRRLLAVARSLPDSYNLVILDGWRPWRVQQHLFDSLYETLHHQHPDANEAQLVTMTREFVSIASRDPRAPSPHLTGGAVDVTLCDADGLMLNMGTRFDEVSPASHTDYFEQFDDGSAEQIARDRRRLLFNAMARQGFTNLPSEWWHYDFGDQLWASYTGATQALYGPTEFSL
ncbi:M15 family metallopeptidase [Nitrincola iocasae]|uniref:M15 family metallopeptidase n=1 Tax=Nitrincola iocasae TaxID=2614693 RepID=UPI001781DB68|nr:M15 family metallopeptidase [Nitrincola iocasae]